MELNNHVKQYDSATDIMKIIASFFVVMIHSSNLHTLSEIFYNAFARFSVPVFVLISGSYMLSRRTSGVYLAKKIGKLFLLMMIWSMIYYMYDVVYSTGSDNDIAGFFTYLLTQPVHLWYIYAIIVLYMFTPLLYVFCKHATKKEYLYALILTFLFGSIVMIAIRSAYFSILSAIIDKTKMGYTLGFVFLYLSGGYLRKYDIPKKSVLYVYILGITGTVVTIAGTLMLSAFNTNKDLLLSFFAPNVLCSGIAFYLFIEQHFLLRPIKNDKAGYILHTMATCTQGVYLIHLLVIMLMQRTGWHFYPMFANYIAIPVQTMVVFTVSILLVYILKKVWVVRWLF